MAGGSRQPAKFGRDSSAHMSLDNAYAVIDGDTILCPMVRVLVCIPPVRIAPRNKNQFVIERA